MSKKARSLARLPKAPLVEVVFELRWRLQEGPPMQPLLHADPGVVPLIDTFTHKIKSANYGNIRDMSHPLITGPYGVARRFFLSPDKPFPIMQIGPGIFATNDGPLYTWKTFKSQIKTGVRVLFASYPALTFFRLHPMSLELRYVDVFDKSALGKATLFHFANTATTLKFDLPAMINDPKVVSGNADGRFVFQRPLRQKEDSLLLLDIGSGKNVESGEDLVRMETKILSRNAGVPPYKQIGQFIKALDDWLEFAHNVTSPFFKQFIRPEIMAKFQEA